MSTLLRCHMDMYQSTEFLGLGFFLAILKISRRTLDEKLRVSLEQCHDQRIFSAAYLLNAHIECLYSV